MEHEDDGVERQAAGQPYPANAGPVQMAAPGGNGDELRKVLNLVEGETTLLEQSKELGLTPLGDDGLMPLENAGPSVGTGMLTPPEETMRPSLNAYSDGWRSATNS